MPGIGADVATPPVVAYTDRKEQWAQDVQVQTTTGLTTTGGTVWGAAHRGIQFLQAVADTIGLTRPGVRILELGAGCGLLGLTLARNLPHAAEVCLTEQAFGGALDHLRANVAANAAAGMPGIGVVTTAACDWTLVMQGDGGGACPHAAATGQQQQQQQQQQRQEQEQEQQEQQQCLTRVIHPQLSAGAAGDNAPTTASQEAADTTRLLSTRWDFIVGSDLVYNEAGTHMLPLVIRALALAGRPHPTTSPSDPQPPGSRPLRDQAVVIYAHTKHRYDICDIKFQEQCAAAGLAVEEVWEPGVQQPPPSPPPLSNLFGDMRVAVWRITVAGEPGELPAPNFW